MRIFNFQLWVCDSGLDSEGGCVCCVACQQGGGTASVCTLYVVYVVGTVRCTVRCVCVVQWEVSQRLFQVWILGLYYYDVHIAEILS
jgi:hypothetical protein